MASLKARILTALIGVPFIILILLSPLPIITLVIMAASCIGLYEYYRAVGLSQHKDICIMGYIAAIVISMSTSYSASTSLILVLVYVYIAALFLIMLFSSDRITLKELSLLIFGLVYIPYFLSHIGYVRAMDFGRVYIWLVFIGAFLTDTGAYFVGCLIGKHKLCPNISPKKTIEGAIGGALGGGISFVIFGIIINSFFSELIGGELDLFKLFAFGLVTACMSEIGDLVASAIKRQFEIKDFGNCLPGHGGILDRCDSIILVAPTVFLILYNISMII